MKVTNDEKTVLNSVEKLNVTGDECRICLKRCNEVWQLFHQTDEEISRKLMAIAAIQVEEGDGLPAIICENCRRLLDVSYDFKCQIEKSDAKLREFLILKDDSEKMLSLSHSVDAAITEAIAGEIGHDHSSANPGECVELVNSLVNETAHIVDLNQHHFTDHHQSIIFEIRPPVGENESLIDHEMSIESDNCCDGDVKNIELNDCHETQVANILIEKYNPLEETVMESRHLKNEDMMETEESNMSEYENTECLSDVAIENDNENELPTTADDSQFDDVVKDENYESDEEEKPLISRTQRQKCSQCIKTFPTISALERHAQIHKHKTKLRYVCYMCDKQFSSISKLKDHVVNAHENLRNEEKALVEESPSDTTKIEKNSNRSDSKKNLKFTCKVCGKQFTYQKSFMTHAKSHPDYEPETSNEKDETVGPSEDSNERGNESEDDDMPLEGLQCTQCGKLFATKRNLKRHITTHSGLKFHCATCGKEFSRVDKLKEHEQSKHNEELFASSDSDSDDDTDNENKNHGAHESRKKEKLSRPHQCPMCPKAFAQEQSLTNHMERHKRVKDTQKRFLCEVCSKCFAQSGSLVAHMRTHTGVKPYVCNVCSRAFTKSTYLQLHLRTHSGEKPYICQYCSRAFARANTLARHITMHTGEAKYHCQICTKSFRRLTSLNEHTYTHTGQRPYACKICTKRYNNAGSLYAHTKKCKAQQLSGATTTYTVPIEDASLHNGVAESQITIYSQRKDTEDATVDQGALASQFMIPNVHNPSLKPLPTNIIPQFTVEDPNFCAVNKTYKNPYYPIYPNM